jgi:hypothetical protein
MMSWLLDLLQKADWGEFEPERQALLSWEHYPLLVKAIHDLKRDALFISHIHGEGHIERVLLHGAVLAMRQGCGIQDVALLLDACCYHDTGRIDDSVDSTHGARSAQKLGQLTAWHGQVLQLLQAVVEAHSCWDGDFEKIINRHHVEDVERARRLAILLKDADGLDRVRLHDLDAGYLRLKFSGEQVGFAEWLYRKPKVWEK